MRDVRAKKNLGQHFLRDPAVAVNIVNALSGNYGDVLEIGPGMGILTDFLFTNEKLRVKVIELDQESVAYLKQKFPSHENEIIYGDILQHDINNVFTGEFCIIGNFPYNISTQILFKILDHREKIPEAVGMFQKEVAERIANPPGSREYGILSVFMQTWYEVKVILHLNENDFEPPPKVKSAVLKFVRKDKVELPGTEKFFRKVVKAAFNQRRKTLRNALSVIVPKGSFIDLPFGDLRAEALSWEQFAELSAAIEKRFVL